MLGMILAQVNPDMNGFKLLWYSGFYAIYIYKYMSLYIYMSSTYFTGRIYIYIWLLVIYPKDVFLELRFHHVPSPRMRQLKSRRVYSSSTGDLVKPNGTERMWLVFLFYGRRFYHILIYFGETIKIYGFFIYVLPINQQLQQLQQLSLPMTCGKPDTPRPSPQRGLGHAERSGGAARGAAAGSHVWHWDVADRSARALPCAGTLCRSNAGMGWIYGWYHI